ncbi:ATP-binding protein [Mameliella alba]|nr:ATP-binding protein [Mameliella alba]
MSNLSHFLGRNGTEVRFVGLDRYSASIEFLDDARFFEQHLGHVLVDGCAVRQTTQPLVEIRNEASHGWIGMTLLPWLSECSGVPTEQMAEFRTCISELFNNISDHTELDVGSIFAQWYPQERQLEICIADFGIGIPATVARVESDLTDSQAILRAFEDGFSSKSLPTNQGVGLWYLQKIVVEELGGTLSCQSSAGGVNMEKVGNLVRKVPYDTRGYCPGTLIEVKFSTDTMGASGEDEDFAW